MAMLEDGIGRKVFRDLAEAGFQRWFSARSAHAGLGVAHNAGIAVDYTSLD